MAGWTSGGRLVVLEAGAKQRYIFATNKRREAVGASELVYRVGGKWLDDALRSVDARIVVQTSGLAVLLVESQDNGRELIRSVTRQALRDASGLDVYGVVTEELHLRNAADLKAAQKAAFRKLAQVRAARPGPASRHLRLPLVADCATSGLPAKEHFTFGQERAPRSQESIHKLAAARPGLIRMGQRLGIDPDRLGAAAARLEETDEMVAVIHADGNGLGTVFADFDAETDDIDEHIETLRAFSAAVDRCTHDALRDALNEAGDPDFLPLIVGGDDVTLICEASSALPLAAGYLRAFEAHTAANRLIAERCQAMLGHPRLTAAAGVAVVKPHFPFSVAYSLSGELCDRAKHLVKHPRLGGVMSALDFHVVRDSSPVGLEEHRTLPDGSGTVVRPVVVGQPGHVRSIERIEEAARVVADPDGLPRSQWYALRSAFAHGADEADARYRAVKAERGMAADALLGPSLFEEDAETEMEGTGRGRRVTCLGDALDLLDVAEAAYAPPPATPEVSV